MEDVKVGRMFDVSYVHQLQETLRKLQEHLRDKTAECDRVYKELDRAQVSIGDLQDRHAEAQQALHEIRNSEKEIADELAKRIMVIKELKEEVEKLKSNVDYYKSLYAGCQTDSQRAWVECSKLKEEIAALKDNQCFDIRGLENDIQFHKELSASYCKDYEREHEKNRKLKKRLRNMEAEMKEVESIVTKMEDMFNIRG